MAFHSSTSVVRLCSLLHQATPEAAVLRAALKEASHQCQENHGVAFIYLSLFFLSEYPVLETVYIPSTF